VSDTAYTQCLNGAAGLFLLTAVGMLSRRQLTGMIRFFAVQGIALTAMVTVLGVHQGSRELIAVAGGLLLLRVGVLPRLARRALGSAPREQRELSSSAQITGSLLASAALVLLGYAVTRPLIELSPSPATSVLPVAFSVVLIGLFALTTRHNALSQVVGFMLLDNGITATAFLATSGVPLIVELGVSFDLLLVVVVLQILTVRLRAMFGTTNLDGLRELRD
jgi:hydrogenase-4 component E